MRVYMFVSDDRGDTWTIQFPKCVTAVPLLTKSQQFSTPYRYCPVWDEDSGFMAFGGHLATVDFSNNYKIFGGTCLMTDQFWNGSKREMPAISTVFWLYGIDFSDELCASELSDNVVGWPEFFKVEEYCTLDISDGMLRMTTTGNGVIRSTGRTPPLYQERIRCEHSNDIPDNDVQLAHGWYYHVKNSISGTEPYTLDTSLKDQDDTALITINSDGAAGAAATFDWVIDRTTNDSLSAWFKLLRHDGASQDYEPDGITGSGYWEMSEDTDMLKAITVNETGKWLGLRFAFIRPALSPTNEPAATLGTQFQIERYHPVRYGRVHPDLYYTALD